MEYQKITEVSKNLPKNNSETVTNENDTETLKEIREEERQTKIYLKIYLQKKNKKLLIISYLI